MRAACKPLPQVALARDEETRAGGARRPGERRRAMPEIEAGIRAGLVRFVRGSEQRRENGAELAGDRLIKPFR